MKHRTDLGKQFPEAKNLINSWNFTYGSFLI